MLFRSTAEGYVNSEKGVEAATFLNGLIQDGYANVDPIQQEFHNGKCATMLGGGNFGKPVSGFKLGRDLFSCGR